MILLLPYAVSAQNINDCQWYTCGTGTSTTYNNPLNNFYNYSFVEMLFLANELSGQEGTIYKIGFQYGYSSAMTSKTNVKIYMKNVTVDALASGSGTAWITDGLTQVYSGSLNCSGNGSWNDFTLQTPFNYTGGNLLVVVDDNSGSYNGSSYVFRYTTTTNNTVKYVQSDSYHYTLTGSNLVTSQTGSYGNQRANTRFCIAENCNTHRSGNFAFNPSTATYNYVVGSGDFAEPTLVNTLSPAGTVTYTSSNTEVATVSNTGAVTFTGFEGTVTITATSVSDPYCKEYATYTINVNDGCPKFGTGTSTTSSAPISTFYKNSYHQMIYTAAEIGSGGMINAIGFESLGTNSQPRTIEIYMGETSASSFASAATSEFVPVDQLELVYSGVWNITAGWQMFPVDFLYSGLQNLVIAIKSGASNYSSSNFAYTSGSEYLTLYCYSDTYEPVPANITSYSGSVSRLQYRVNTKICIDPCTIRPTFEFENTMAMCYQGANCPMLPLANTSNGAVHYTSSDESIATVDADGNITTIGRGETTITARLEMDGDVCPAKAEYILQVVCPALIPSAESVSLCEGGSVTLNASTAGGGELEWFDVVDATVPVHTGETYTVNATQSTTYYVATYNEDFDCASSRVPAYVNVFDVAYESTTQNISGYVGVTMYGFPPSGTTSGTSYTASGMPAWMTLNPDGSFNGTPTAAGSGTFTITASNGGCSKTITISWSVVANNLSCCDPDAFYLFKDGDPLPIRMDADGYYYINVCKDEPSTFRIQSLANCTGYTYSWRLASSTGGLLENRTGTSFSYTFDRAMGYNMTLTITKSNPNGCSVALPIRIRVAGVFQVATRPSFDLCKGEPFNIYVSSDGIGSVDVVRPNGASGSTMGVADTIFLPDGLVCNGSCSYVSSVTFTDFSAGATIRDENDLLYLMINLEHSFMGDIAIYLTCPNGTSVSVMNQSGSGSSSCTVPSEYVGWVSGSTSTSTAFGICNDCTASDYGFTGDYTTDKCNHTPPNNQPGIGWNYCWSENNNRGYVYASSANSRVYESANHNSNTPCNTAADSSDMQNMTQIYRPDGDFSNFVGCPLNGQWTITVIDGWSVDNGYIFGWELGLNEDLLPDSWTYSVDIDSAWTECNWNTTKSGVYMEITPPEDFVGTTTCDLNLRDEYGCISHYQNIVTVTMNPTVGNTDVVTECDSYTWPRTGVTYTVGDTIIDNQLTDHGCPDRDTLILTLNYTHYDTVDEQACHNFTWPLNGQDYTTSTSVTETLSGQAVGGCDSIVTLNLEILPELTTTKDTSVCPITFPFDWYGSHFTEAGTLVQNLQTAGGCDSIVTLTVNELSKPEITLTNPSEAGQCPIATTANYTVTSSVTGGTANFTYAWSGDYTGTDANATIPGTGTCGDFSVEVIVTDANGCMDTANTSFSAVDTEAPTFGNPVTETPALLSGANCIYKVPDVIALIQPADNCQIVSQEQNPLANSNITEATDVTVTVTDECGQVSTHTVHLTIPDPLQGEIDNTNVACNGGHNGEVWVFNMTGGTPDYHYAWSTTDGNSDGLTDTDHIYSRMGGTYNVTVSDANGCTLDLSTTISEAGDLVSTLTPTAVQCYQTATGSIVIDSVRGGTPGYTYNWSNGSHSDTGIENVEPGEYSLTIIDAEGCSITVTATVDDRPQLTIDPGDQTNVDCYGNNTGSLAVVGDGGVTPYRYVLSDTDTNSTGSYSSLTAGTYTIQIIDAMGCKNSTTMTLTQPDSLRLDENMTAHHDVQCNGGTDGSFTVVATYGTSPYTYTIDGTSTSNTNGAFSNQSAGTYYITVTDDHGCTAKDTVVIEQPTALTVEEVTGDHVDISCYGFTDGQLHVQADGGTTPYTYTLSGTSNSTGLFANLGVGNYTVNVVDGHGCENSITIPIESLTPMSISETYHLDVNCNGENNGAFTVEATGGAEGFQYQLNGGAAAASGAYTDLLAGTYYVTATDAHGCFLYDTIVITEPAVLQLIENNAQHHNVDCYGNSTGGVTITASGGTQGYTYELNGATNTTGVFQNQLAENDYTATVTDAHGCSTTLPISITQPTLLKLAATHVDLRCKLDGTGSIDITPTGGTTPYSYRWSINGNNNYATTQDLNNIQANTYSITVTDANGCTHDTTITVTEPEGMTLTMSDPVTICLHDSADILATVRDGTPPYRFTWSNGHTNNGVTIDQQTVTPNTTTTYTVNVLDAGDCPMTDNVTVTVNYPTTGIDNQRACDSYVWPTNGAEYTASTNAPMVSTLTNAAGCDSTAILHLVVVYSSEGVDQHTACDKYVWQLDGQAYTASTNTPSVVLHNANSAGCDSTVTLDLTINNSTTTHDTDMVLCENDDPYVWNGRPYSTAGTYEVHLNTSAGCDSTVWFTLTVHDTNHTYIYDTCMVKELPWSWGGRSYPTPVTDDLFSLQNVYGCDSLVFYNLEAIFDCSEFLQFPSVVTPNGDGLNDIFHIVGLIEEACYPLNKLTIYNRWGAKVYEVANIDEESDFWDPAADRIPAGTYYFRFDGDGFKGHVERKGVVEVVR
ncbi:MAG: gliding motility-associated C-terminal domain-containing protein [Bacteroidales bacterium]|nr:gliding motility-associated C-terminal domain-containing protein [Bacteroidales bacterium]